MSIFDTQQHLTIQGLHVLHIKTVNKTSLFNINTVFKWGINRTTINNLVTTITYTLQQNCNNKAVEISEKGKEPKIKGVMSKM